MVSSACTRASSSSGSARPEAASARLPMIPSCPNGGCWPSGRRERAGAVPALQPAPGDFGAAGQTPLAHRARPIRCYGGSRPRIRTEGRSGVARDVGRSGRRRDALSTMGRPGLAVDRHSPASATGIWGCTVTSCGTPAVSSCTDRGPRGALVPRTTRACPTDHVTVAGLARWPVRGAGRSVERGMGPAEAASAEVR